MQYVQSWTPDDGRKDRPKHVELFQNNTNLRHWCGWFYYKIYYDARPCERKILRPCSGRAMHHWSLKMRPLHCLEMVGNKHPVTEYNITEGLSFV